MLISRRSALAAPAALVAGRASAQAGFPPRPVRIIVPYSPGGAADIAARTLSERLSPGWGQPVVVENRAGGNGIVGTEAVARGPVDGTNLACVSIVHAVNVPLYRTPYDTLRDLRAVSILYSVPLVVTVAPDFPASTMAELAALARRDPARATCVGTGGLYCAMFNMQAGTEIEQIPYRGSTAAHPDLMVGRVGFIVDTLPAVLGHVQTGKLKALATTGTHRLSALPDVPTVVEAGFPDFLAASWGALLAPASLPDALAERISADVRAALRDGRTRERMSALGAEVVVSTPAEAQDFLRAEVGKWSAVAANAKIEKQ